MSLRYLIAISRRPSQANEFQHLSASCALPCVHTTTRCVIFASEAKQVLHLGDGGGVILGHLFQRSGQFPRVTRLAETETESILSSNGGHLLTNYWGGYVAVLDDPSLPTVCIMRDPSGALPCYVVPHQHLTLLASDLDLLLRTGWPAPQVDWAALAGKLLANGLSTSATCLKGVSELLAGTALDVAPTGPTVRAVWSPWDHVAPSSETYDQLTERLRHTVLDCTAAWGRSLTLPLLGVSGGLDSSIVAAALSSQQIPFLAFTMATQDAMGDERPFARGLSRHLHFELIERQHRHQDIDLTKSMSAHRPRPGMAAYGQSNLRLQQALADERQCGAFFSGVGGDNVFCLMQSATPLVDRIMAEGALHALNTLRDLRDLTSAGIFDIVRMAARTWQHRRAPYDWPLTTRFLDHEILEGSGTGLGHDWLRPPTQALRGKRIHIARLIPLQADGNIFPRDRFGPLVLPLLAQPIVELCLSIPTWMWCAGGRDRSVARQAFADLLPHAIVQRRSKGGPDNFACQVIERNKAQLRDMLLNGQLARHGLLDVASVASALADIGAVHGKDHLRLAALAEAEAWASHWVRWF